MERVLIIKVQADLLWAVFSVYLKIRLLIGMVFSSNIFLCKALRPHTLYVYFRKTTRSSESCLACLIQAHPHHHMTRNARTMNFE